MNPRPYQKSHLARPGFSLVEMLVVIFIAGILIAITVGAIGAMNKMGAKSQTQAIISAFDAALDQTKDATGEYPRVAFAATDLTTNPSDMNATKFAEATWMNQCLNYLSPNRLDPSRASLDANNALMSILKPYTDTYSTTFTPATFKLTEFRNATNAGIRNTGNSDISAPALNPALTDQGGKISFVRDAWDRYLVYFPSNSSGDAEAAATLRPLIASAGADGYLESTPWRFQGGTIAYKKSTAGATPIPGSRVYYKQRWYESKTDHSSTTSSLPPPQDTTNWMEMTSDDIITRGDWR